MSSWCAPCEVLTISEAATCLGRGRGEVECLGDLVNMDLGQPGTSGGVAAQFFDFLNDSSLNDDDLFRGAEGLDAATLDAVCAALPQLPRPASSKRLKADPDEDDEDDEGWQETAPADMGGGRRSKAEARQAAKNKATREKARREKINDRCCRPVGFPHPFTQAHAGTEWLWWSPSL